MAGSDKKIFNKSGQSSGVQYKAHNNVSREDVNHEHGRSGKSESGKYDCGKIDYVKKKEGYRCFKPFRNFIHPATMFFLLGLIVVLLSWVGSVYNWDGIQNLLSTEAMRWILRYSKDNMASCPAFVAVCILFMGGGLFIHSGLWDAIWRFINKGHRLSGKEKSSLIFAAFTAAVYISLFSVLAWGPWNIVRGVTGTFAGSPLHDGLVTIISLGIGLTSVVYGFSSDYYRRDTDVIDGMSYLFSSFSSYFVSLFFAVQFLASLQYSGLAGIMGLDGYGFYILQWVCYLIPLRRN